MAEFFYRSDTQQTNGVRVKEQLGIRTKSG